jgi:hypothetical protein
VGERKEVAGCSTADRCGEGSKDVAAEIGEDQITRLACHGGEEKEIRERRRWWGIAAGCGLGTIRKLAALICFGFERERWLLATLHLEWERKELNQWLASSGRKKDQRKGSSTVKGAGACCSDG